VVADPSPSKSHAFERVGKFKGGPTIWRGKRPGHFPDALCAHQFIHAQTLGPDKRALGGNICVASGLKGRQEFAEQFLMFLTQRLKVLFKTRRALKLHSSEIADR
jgi:hypothetical protein